VNGICIKITLILLYIIVQKHKVLEIVVFFTTMQFDLLHFIEIKEFADERHINRQKSNNSIIIIILYFLVRIAKNLNFYAQFHKFVFNNG